MRIYDQYTHGISVANSIAFRIFPADSSGSSGSNKTQSSGFPQGPLTFEWSIPALAQINPCLCLTISVLSATRTTSLLSCKTSSTNRGIFSGHFCNLKCLFGWLHVVRLTNRFSLLETIFCAMTRISPGCSSILF